jgi:hypothetical protein
MPPASPGHLARKAQMLAQTPPADLSLMFRDWENWGRVKFLTETGDV